jgi:hypothetical protein
LSFPGIRGPFNKANYTAWPPDSLRIESVRLLEYDIELIYNNFIIH